MRFSGVVDDDRVAAVAAGLVDMIEAIADEFVLDSRKARAREEAELTIVDMGRRLAEELIEDLESEQDQSLEDFYRAVKAAESVLRDRLSIAYSELDDAFTVLSEVG